MFFRIGISALFQVLLSSCALVTTPVKVVGKATSVAIGVTGKAVGAGFDAKRNCNDHEQDSKKE